MKTKGLTLREAKESGCTWFKRSQHIYWYKVSECGRYIESSVGFSGPITVEDALATDWEIKVEPREFWILVTEGGLAVRQLFDSRHEAESSAMRFPTDRIVRVKEVLE